MPSACMRRIWLRKARTSGCPLAWGNWGSTDISFDEVLTKSTLGGATSAAQTARPTPRLAKASADTQACLVFFRSILWILCSRNDFDPYLAIVMAQLADCLSPTAIRVSLYRATG